MSKAVAAGSRLEGDVEVKRVWKAGVRAELCFTHSVIAGILQENEFYEISNKYRECCQVLISLSGSGQGFAPLKAGPMIENICSFT